MRISSRLALAGSVVVMAAAATGVALSMPGIGEGPVSPAPELTASAQQQEVQPQAAAPQQEPPAEARPADTPPEAAAPESDPVEAARPAAPPLTGEQIAALAATPARERAATLIAEARAERERQDDEDDESDESDEDDESQADKWDKLRDELQEACDEGRIRGAICGDA